MKRLILIRHGDAPGGSYSDLERILTPNGKKQVAGSAEFLKSYQIDNILCSPVKRTVQTLDIIKEILQLNDNIITFSPIIYSNSPLDIINLIKENPDSSETLLVVGHNPSLFEIANIYDLDIEDKWSDYTKLGFRPAQVIEIEFQDVNKWSELTAGKGVIKNMFTP